MKKWIFLYWVLLLSLTGMQAQVSHGGRPLPLSTMRSLDGGLFKEMPAFDVAEQLCLDSLNESDLRSGYRFAYKFMTDYNRTNSGVSFTRPDGTKVWRLGIRSKGALSINLLFTEYEVPEGAQVFLYNADQTQILGAFTHLNNSDLHILPVAPIRGEEVIVEYQEPARAAFPGRLTVGEVNHGYRSLRGDEPREDKSWFACMPPLACYADETEPYGAWGRSVVMLMIDGSVACTGVLLNNTAGDGKPYLLTASHCLNRQFQLTNPDYAQIAGTIVSFFNYDSPLCSTVMRGTEEMSVASAYCVAVNEKSDMALLELTETPPVYYRPYYAGWNAREWGAVPYSGIHHPGGAVKRINRSEKELSQTTFRITETDFYEKAHLLVSEWAEGCTAGGSSGSPLFNASGQVLGALSGGSSTCTNPGNDYYYALSAAWNPTKEPTEQLACWLDPIGDSLSCEGLDPYISAPCFRLSNICANGKAETIETTALPAKEGEPLFGNNSTGVTEYAEAYRVQKKAVLYGAYFVTPSAGDSYREMKVTVHVYAGQQKPETLLHTEVFQPSYSNKVSFDDTFQETIKPLNRSQESFVLFSEPLPVEGNFYISYRIEEAPGGTFFSVYNLPSGEVTGNTAWVKKGDEWMEASVYPASAFPTSLFIDPVVQYTVETGIGVPKAESPVWIYRGAEPGLLHIHLPERIASARYTLFAVGGQACGQGALQGGRNEVRVAKHTPGLYFIQIKEGNNSYVEKILF